MSTAEISVAMIGAGAMAREHARAFADVPGVKLAGIFNRTRVKAEKLAQEFGFAHVCNSVSELYERTGAQLLILTISPVYVKDIGFRCFEFPWCVFMEKPPGLNYEETVAINAAATRAGSKVLVALNRRFYSSTRTALCDLSQRPGTRHILVLDQQNLDFCASLGHEQAILDNWHYCCSVHLIDYLRVFGRGKPSVQLCRRWNPRQPNVVTAHLSFDSGDSATYECMWAGPGPWAVMVTTPEKRWEMRPLENLSSQDAGKRVLVPHEIHPWDTKFKAGFRLQAEHAVAEALGRPSDSVSLSDALESVRLVKEIYAAEQ